MKESIDKKPNAFVKFFDKYQTVISILLFFLVWELAVRIFHVSEAFLCTPSSALKHLLFKQPDADYHWKINITCTLYEFLLGFLATAAGGILLSVILVWSKTVQKIVMPLFVFLNSMPIVAITPLLIIWLGYGLHTNIFVAFLASFFPMVINTMAGLNSIDHDLLDLVDYLNASKFQVFWKIRLPNALPYIFSGLKICSTLSVMGVIVGELIASDKGLGYVIANSQKTMDTPPMFASLIMMSLLGWAMYFVVCVLERVCMPWKFVRQKK
jgi:NitT/TauT family transport system permease protein